jgi:hypothetical protein
MIAGFQHELIVLPAAARSEIPARLGSAGITVAPSQKSIPEKFKDAGVIYECRQNKGTAEILIIDDARMLAGHRSLVAVLVSPGRGALADWLSGTTDGALRKKIHEVLYAFRNEVTTQQSACT